MRVTCLQCQTLVGVISPSQDEIVCPACGASIRLETAKPAEIANHAKTKENRPLGKPLLNRPETAEDVSLSYLVTTVKGDLTTLVDAAAHREIQTSFASGRILQDRYVLERELGRGGMGQVYLGTDTRLSRPVAIKVMLTNSAHAEPDTIAESRLRQAFAEEARLGANLTHPVIATVFDFGFHEGKPFTVFEYVPGETLQDLLHRCRRLPLEEVRLIVAPLAQALDFAHSHHVVHRDLKPANIRTTPQGQFKIVDLGLAREFRRDVDWSRFAGTPAYASPEQAAGLPSDGRTDQYALALITYEMLTGQRPFRSSNPLDLLRMHREDKPPSPQTIASDVPETVCVALVRALEKEPNRRFTTCEEFAVAIGCQFLSAPAPLPEILLETEAYDTASVSFEWRWAANLFNRIHLVLVRDALWFDRDGKTACWPLRDLSTEEKKATQWGSIETWFSKKTHLLITSKGAEKPLELYFLRAEECGQWHEQIEAQKKLRQDRPSSEEAAMSFFSVVFVQKKPNVRCQLLGNIEVTRTRRRTAESALRIQAAMLGADAVVEFQSQRLPGLDQTQRRLSGTAVRAVDKTGLIELKTSWFDEQVVKLNIGLWCMIVITLVFSALTLCGLSPARLLLPEGDSALSGTPSRVLQQIVFSATLPLVALCGGPLGFYLLVRWLKWPQLVPTIAIALFAMGVGPLVQCIGYFGEYLFDFSDFGWTNVSGYRKFPGSPFFGLRFRVFIVTIVPIVCLGYLLARRTWKAYQEFHRVLLVGGHGSPRFRSVVSAWVIAGSVAVMAALLSYEAWLGRASARIHDWGAASGFSATWDTTALAAGLSDKSARIREWAAMALEEAALRDAEFSKMRQ